MTIKHPVTNGRRVQFDTLSIGDVFLFDHQVCMVIQFTAASQIEGNYRMPQRCYVQLATGIVHSERQNYSVTVIEGWFAYEVPTGS
jgi:hypothetical protein